MAWKSLHRNFVYNINQFTFVLPSHLIQFLVSMENSDQAMSSAASLQLIQQMIQEAKHDLSDRSFDFLFWGWLVLLASLGNYALLQLNYKMPWLPWVVLMPLGGLFMVIYHWRQEKKRRVSTPVGDAMAYLWAAFAVLMVFSMGLGAKYGWNLAYPLMIALYGLGTFTTGGILRFRPLVWGGAACWLLATLAFRVDLPTQLLLIAAAVLVSYIIPGHLLKAQYRRGRAL
jgi:hypothetical protein